MSLCGDGPTYGQRKGWNNDLMDPDWRPSDTSTSKPEMVKKSDYDTLQKKLETAVTALKTISTYEDQATCRLSLEAELAVDALKLIQGAGE